MYIDHDLQYTVIEKTSNEAFQSLWVEINFAKKANVICGVLYRQHNSPERFLAYFEETIERFSATGKTIYVMGDTNLNILRSDKCTYAQNFFLCLQSYNLLPTIDRPTRVHNNSATLIDNIFINNLENIVISGNIVSDISDHFSQFCIVDSAAPVQVEKPIYTYRDYSNFSDSEFLLMIWQVLTGTRLPITMMLISHSPLFIIN